MAGLVALTTALSLAGAPPGSKLVGAAWAFVPIVAFVKTRIHGAAILGVVVTAFTLQAVVNAFDPGGSVTDAGGDMGPLVWTIMLGAATAMGLGIGWSSRRTQRRRESET